MENFIIRRGVKKNKVEEGGINVYTDGACVDNGKPYARAGYGVYFGKNAKAWQNYCDGEHWLRPFITWFPLLNVAATCVI